MKRFCTILFFLAACFGTARAQVSVDAGWCFSVLNYRNDSGSYLLFKNAQAGGFYASASYNHVFWRGVGAGIGVNYSRVSGTDTDFSLFHGYNSPSSTLEVEQYITIPVEASYRYEFQGIGLAAIASAGLSPSICLSSGQTFTVQQPVLDSWSETKVDNFNTDPSYTRAELMISAGAGLEYRSHYLLRVRFGYGLTDRNKKAETSISRLCLSVGIGYSF